MRLESIRIACITAREIEQLLTNVQPGGTVRLEVKDPHNNSTEVLEFRPFPLKKGRLLHGRAVKGVHIFIRLGDAAEADVKQPSVFISRQEPKKGTESSSLINNSKRRR